LKVPHPLHAFDKRTPTRPNRIPQIDLIKEWMIGELSFDGAVHDRHLWWEPGFEQEDDQLGGSPPYMDEYCFGPCRFRAPLMSFW
jgi:hypothetical protein